MRAISPSLSEFAINKFMQKMRIDTWPELANHPAFTESDLRTLPSVSSTNPTVGDELAINLLNSSVESVHAIDSFTGPASILLVDGTQLHDIDAIICCTGYSFDFSLLPSSVDPMNPALIPTHLNQVLRSAKPKRQDLVIPWAYRGLISISHPHSLAFFGNTIYRRGLFPLYDLISMAVAQLWTNSYPMPTRTEMEAERAANFAFFLSELEKGDVRHTGLMTAVEFDIWLHKVAGTGVWERLGWGLEGWKFWWNERELWKLLMDGVDSPHALRLFESGRVGGRRVWSPALEALKKANREVQEGVDRWRRENEEAKAKVEKE
jgi:dimethylaniline monooxygenase (N-oxide forming)